MDELRLRLGWPLAAALGCMAALTVSTPAAAKCPSWVSSRAAGEFPRDRYLVGLGVVSGVWDEAQGMERGKTAAFADIAHQLSASVSSEVMIAASETSGNRSRTTATEHAEIRSELVLRGARMVRRCFDADTATLYLLAVVDREEAVPLYRNDLAAVNARGAADLAALRQALTARDDLGVLRRVSEVLTIALEAERIAAVLRGLGDPAPELFASIAEVRELEETAQRRSVVQVAVTDSTGELTAEITRRLTASGARVTSSASQDASAAALVVSGEVVILEVAASRTGAVIARVRASVQVKQAGTDVVLATVVQEATGGASTKNAAIARAASSAGRSVTESVHEHVRQALGLRL